MNTEASPRPWRAKQSPIGSNTWIVSGETFVASASSPADARLIVDAVNERDRLRDLVRRLLMLRRGDIAVPMDMEKQILAEARAAIGENKE